MTDLNFENNRLLDVVNEKDEVIDSEPRKDVHRLGLLHREIHVWMFDEDNNIIFQKRGWHSPSAGRLDASVGGHVNKGEEYIEAAIREVKEEVGISVSDSDLIVLRKFRGTFNSSENDFLNTVNNFIRTIYLFKNPIKDGQIKKEDGIPGGGFQKLTPNFLVKPDEEDIKLFVEFVLKEEIPYVLKYTK